MLIKARLTGHEFDLLTLAERFCAGDPAVAAADEGYYLRFAVPDEFFRDGGGLHDAALVLLRRVNGVAQALSSEVRPVGLPGRFSDESGRHHQVVLADSAEVRARANLVRVSVDGEQPPPPPAPGPGYVPLAQIHPDVAGVVDLLGTADPAPGWAELDKVHEILLASVPGFYQRGWVTRDQISTFTALANRSQVSGDLARRARLKG